MNARRPVGAAIAVLLAVLVVAGPALAETRRASIGNFWYEDDEQRDRTKIVVRQGDQITFTVREGIFPPHTIDVDELDIHSPGLLLGETFTTPPLNKVGNFRLYCRPHEARGHFTRLIIQSVAAPTPAAPAAPAQTSAPGGGVASSPTPTPTPQATLAPVGVGRAPADDLRRPVAVDPDSLEGLTGRVRSTEPWTRALWFTLIASIPIVGAAIFALRREHARAPASTGSSPSQRDRPRSTSRSPRSSARKASGSARRSGGRRR